MTGIGAYFYIMWGIWLRHCLNYRQDDYEMIWPHLLSLPVVVKRENSSSKVQNGSAKKSL
jgi:dihydroceramidase